jgi:hypothetical protein
MMSPAELYKDPAIADRWLRFNPTRFSLPAEDTLIGAGMLAVQDDPVRYLEALPDSANQVRRVITHLPPQTILENYGEKVLVWAAANEENRALRSELKKALGELAGYDEDLFAKAKIWSWNPETHAYPAAEVLSQYRVMARILDGGLEVIDLPELLKKSARPGVTISDKRAQDYGVLPVRAIESDLLYADGEVDGWWGKEVSGITYELWLDAPTGFVLTYKERPQAMAGVAACNKGLMIHQLQGIRGYVKDKDDEEVRYPRSARGLPPLDWQKLLVSISAGLARDMGMASISIQTGSKNVWAKPSFRSDWKVRLNEKNAHIAYDMPAHNLGFQPGPDGNWHSGL